MIVLGIDTSNYTNAIGICENGRVLVDFNFEARTDSLQKIVVNIDEALQKVGLTLKEIEGFGVGLGPGSWTGIRVGVTVAKMLAFSTDRPISGIPTLEVMAYGAKDEEKLVCPVISVGTGDTVYAAFYRVQDGSVKMIGEYYVGGIAGLSALIKEPVVITGPEAAKYGQLMGERIGTALVSAKEGEARGAAVALLAEKRLELGRGDNPLSLSPLYLKESTAKAFLSRYSGIKEKC